MRSSAVSVVLSLLLLLSLLSPFIVARSHLKSLRSSDVSDGFVDFESPVPVLTATPTSPATAVPSLPSTAVSPALNTGALRYEPPRYLYITNTTAEGLQVDFIWSVSSITEKLTNQLSPKEAERQQKRLDKHLQRLNRSWSNSYPSNGSSSEGHKESHHGEGHHSGKKHYSELASFYLRHAQCRACVQSNYDLITSTSRLALPAYQPNAVMKFCTLQTPLLPHEQSPSALNPQPLQDWEGSCVPATSDCPSNTVDLNILSTSTCANDVPVTKQSCALCVLDGYEWRTHKRAVKGGDNYDGSCGSLSGSARSQSGWGVTITSLDECPSVVASERAQQKMQQVKGGFFFAFSFVTLLCLCLGLRRCCQVRKARRAARLTALQAQNGVSIPVAEPVHVISASASQPSSNSYPGRVAQAQERAREVRHHAVAMQEPLLVSSGLNPPFYPQLSNPPPYGYRM